MTQTTITEALAELKTIQKRLAKKREFVLTYLARQEIVKDPLIRGGGSEKAISEAMQAIRDLNLRLLSIRNSIARSNLDTQLTVLGQTYSVADWLVWRREVSPGEQQFLNRVSMTIRQVREQAQRVGAEVLQPGVEGKNEKDIVVNVNELSLAAGMEEHEEILGVLDGKLSVLNATTVIDID